MTPESPRFSRIRIVLVAPSHPGNIGATARAMSTMGLGTLVLVAPKRFPDPEATALATGATRVLEAAHVVATLEEAIAGCMLTVGLSARRRAFAGRVLPIRTAAAEAIANATHGAIPANPESASLNLAAAVQVAAYELRMAAVGGDVWRAPRFKPATADEIAELYAHASRTLVAMRFLDPRMPRRLLPRLRRLFARAGLEKEEVNILRGILARIDQFLKR